uniref:Apolipoprotein L, 1 n=1 Tax=Neogobius melanostomus TaxID=47308 RepID=A0A8C6WJL8_9GOBI
MFGGMFKKSPKPSEARRPSQDNLSTSSELSGSQDSLTVNNKEGGGMFGGMFRKSPNVSTKSQEKAGFFDGMFKSKGLDAKSQSQDDLSESSGLSGSTDNLTEKPSKGGVGKLLKNPFASSAQEKSSDSDTEEVSDNGEDQPSGKQQTEKSLDLSDDDTKEENDKPKEHKQAGKKVLQFEQRDQSETILVPNRSNNEMKKEAVSKGKRVQPSKTPAIPPKPSTEEMNRAQKNQDPEETVSKNGRLYPTLNKSDDEALDDDKSTKDKEEEKETVKVRRPKRHNSCRPRAGAMLASVETEEEKEAENDEASAQEGNEVEEGGNKAEVEEGGAKAEVKARKSKKRNPFMPNVKAKVTRKAQEEAEGDKSLFDRLEEFRVEPLQPENCAKDVDNLMDWWSTVDNWEDTPQFDDMTPKEEAKAFAVTAEKIQKGIRVFNKLFSERAESLWQHVIDLNGIADGLDKFTKKTKIAQITGGSTSATGGVLTITGLALAPVTMGTSLIVTLVGLGIATAGGLTSAGAGISNQVNNSLDRKKVEKIVEDYQEKMVDLNKALSFIKQGIENLRQFDLMKIKKAAYNNEFPALTRRFYEDGAMAGKAILINANEIMRVVQIANVAGSTAARAVQIASMATGVLTGLFVAMDIYFVTKDSKELKKGAKSEFAAKIREVAKQLHDGLVELNTIREELQPKPEDEQEGGQPTEGEKKKEVKYSDEEEEDEIDRIKKEMKKDYENREWV